MPREVKNLKLIKISINFNFIVVKILRKSIKKFFSVSLERPSEISIEKIPQVGVREVIKIRKRRKFISDMSSREENN